MEPLGTGDPLRLGPYRLLGVLGAGGMGKVYFGQDGSGATAAVKVLRPELAYDQNLAQRFVREAHMAQAVRSTGVARVLGAQTEGGRPWIATEFLTGPTLDQAVVAHGPVDEPTLRVLGKALSRTLMDIHAAGLIHRDLKPSNIVLTSAGPRVIDFGIARPEHGLTLTTTGQVPATPGYGAPEQVLGQRVGALADVFSLGAVLVFAVTGSQAFGGTHVAAVQYEVVHGTARLDRVPPQLAPLISSCLSKDPTHRPTPAQLATVFAPPRGAERIWRHGPLATDIKRRERTIHQLTTVVRGTGSSVHGISRRRLITTLAVGATVLAAGGGTAAWWLRQREEPDLFALPPAAKSPDAPLSAASTKPSLTPLWGPIRAVGKNSDTPLPVRDVLIVGAPDGGLAAHDVVDGKRRWTAPEVNEAGGMLSLSDALIAAADEKGRLVTYVASSGEPRWTAPAAAKRVLAADDWSVYVITKDGRLRSVSRSDGKIRWTARIDTDLLTKLPPYGVAAQGRLLIATDVGKVVAVDTANGRLAWQLENQASFDRAALVPAVSGDTVLINGRTLTARSLSDGTERWAKSEVVEGKMQPSGPPLVRGGTVHTSQGPHAMSYSIEDGSEEWKSPKGYFIHSPVAVQGGAAFAINTRISGDRAAVWAMGLSRNEQVLTYFLAGNTGPWAITGSGNRVFIRDGASLLALPAFA
ncbi:serine/threonine-protein kinase [Streptomyces peucetius]|nr:hypothetical protein CGZ69_13240 [Streptomyces peucetius subsp. caesius ATCC 27952]